MFLPNSSRTDISIERESESMYDSLMWCSSAPAASMWITVQCPKRNWRSRAKLLPSLLVMLRPGIGCMVENCLMAFQCSRSSLASRRSSSSFNLRSQLFAAVSQSWTGDSSLCERGIVPKGYDSRPRRLTVRIFTTVLGPKRFCTLWSRYHSRFIRQHVDAPNLLFG